MDSPSPSPGSRSAEARVDCDHVPNPGTTATNTDNIIGEIKSNTFEEHLTDSGSTNVSVHVSHSLPETKTET